MDCALGRARDRGDGNHDIKSPDAYGEVFELPGNGPAGVPAEHDYWFDYASARFVVIESTRYKTDEVTLRDVVAPWLSQVLTGAPVRWEALARTSG